MSLVCDYGGGEGIWELEISICIPIGHGLHLESEEEDIPHFILGM